MKCPSCGAHIPTRLLKSEAARLSNKARMVHGGGRPRSDAERCPCGASTMKRAKARGFDCCRRAGVAVPHRAKER